MTRSNVSANGGLRQFDLANDGGHGVESVDGDFVAVGVGVSDSNLDPTPLAVGNRQRHDRRRQIGTADLEHIARLDTTERKRDVLGVSVLLQRRCDRSLEFIDRPEVALDSANELATTVLQALETVLALHDIGIGPELGKGQVEELSRPILVVSPDEVRRHVVCRAERRREDEVSA